MLTLEQRIEVELEIRRRELFQEAKEKYFDSLAAFVRDAWEIIEPVNVYRHGWVIDAMCEHLQAVTDGKIKRLLINVPPGCMKSLLVNVFWPSWEWGVRRKSHYRYILVSHNEDLSIRDNIRARRLITSEWYQDRFSHIKLVSDQRGKGKFENTRAGFRQAMPFGSVTGARGDRVIIDDPHSVKMAESEATRDHVGFIFREAIPSRLNCDDSAIVIIMQRLHEQDVSGIVLSEMPQYTHLCLPMEFEPERKCTTSIGFSDPRAERHELLFPEMYPQGRVDELKKALGSVASAGQLQQSPVPRGGSIIKAEWVQIVDVLPKSFTFILQSWDTAFKTGTKNDYSAGTTWGMLDGNLYLIDLIKQKLEMHDLLNAIEGNFMRFNAHKMLIEDKASGQSIIQVLKRKFAGQIIASKVDGDKVARCNAVAPMFESGKVFVFNAPWTKDYIKSLTSFPNAQHDDDVDSTTMALAYLHKIQGSNIKQIRADVFTR